MTRRVECRLTGRSGHLKVHFEKGKDHLHRSEADNVHNERLIRFLDRFLESATFPCP